MRSVRPPLLAVTAIAATVSVVANGVGAISAAAGPAATRLGISIERDLQTQAASAAQRNRVLELREQAERATEARLKADLAGLKTAAKSGVVAEAPTGEQFDSLARVYQVMKPARAAHVFEQLDMSVQMQVAIRMRDRSTAAIMAAMTAKGAADLSMALARKSAFPLAPATASATAVKLPPPNEPPKSAPPGAGSAQ